VQPLSAISLCDLSGLSPRPLRLKFFLPEVVTELSVFVHSSPPLGNELLVPTGENPICPFPLIG